VYAMGASLLLKINEEAAPGLERPRKCKWCCGLAVHDVRQPRICAVERSHGHGRSHRARQGLDHGCPRLDRRSSCMTLSKVEGYVNGDGPNSAHQRPSAARGEREGFHQGRAARP
jgi:hypothetical protein